MSWEFRISPFARNDANEAYEWYESKASGLGVDFLEQIETSLERLREAPLSHAIVLDDFRRIPVKRFPYGIYYEVQDKRIEVFGVYHASRDILQLRERR